LGVAHVLIRGHEAETRSAARLFAPRVTQNLSGTLFSSQWDCS
jgi:hypothetical protein